MVVFPPACIPALVNTYSTVPVVSALRTQVLHEWAVGGFFQFRNPRDILSIDNRQDFHELSHYQMRQRLDAEGQTDGFVLIDGDTAEKDAIWWITSTEQSLNMTRDLPEGCEPPVTYPDEDNVLWKIHIRIQDLPLLLVDWYEPPWPNRNDFLYMVTDGTNPYDPHDPQSWVWSSDVDYTSKKDSAWRYLVTVTAGPTEYEVSEDEDLRRKVKTWGQLPNYVFRLTEEAAEEAGLVTYWHWQNDKPPVGEPWKIQTYYDWDSPLWAWDEVALRRLERLGP
ncbi:MAG: hypothetical protein Q9174_004695, partial [Haloplaca sp. 1 TL-2023]